VEHGNSRRDAIRSLKRHLARRFHQLLLAQANLRARAATRVDQTPVLMPCLT
jgi:hypothetical protein